MRLASKDGQMFEMRIVGYQFPQESFAMTVTCDGAQRLRSAVSASALQGIEHAVADLPAGRAGIRLRDLAALRPFLAPSGPVGLFAARALGQAGQPVRAILFDKTPTTNWPLGWHQDRTIAVVERVEVTGFGPWSVKHGIIHVEPPFELLAGMVTLRIHLDSVPATNAPLLIAPGSHRLGRIPACDVRRVVQRCGAFACTADVGDIWLYSTPILHASEAALSPCRRRVLQVDYAIGDLPDGLRWLGV